MVLKERLTRETDSGSPGVVDPGDWHWFSRSGDPRELVVVLQEWLTRETGSGSPGVVNPRELAVVLQEWFIRENWQWFSRSG